jgi:hypothetical protein
MPGNGWEIEWPPGQSVTCTCHLSVLVINTLYRLAGLSIRAFIISNYKDSPATASKQHHANSCYEQLLGLFARTAAWPAVCMHHYHSKFGHHLETEQR